MAQAERTALPPPRLSIDLQLKHQITVRISPKVQTRANYCGGQGSFFNSLLYISFYSIECSIFIQYDIVIKFAVLY